MRLIDADRLLEDKKIGKYYHLKNGDTAIPIIDIRHAPTIEERKKGKWIYNSPVTMKCDQCGFVIKDWDWHRFKFCPNCDCDMRGEQE